jgi:hypothetical protein
MKIWAALMKVGVYGGEEGVTLNKALGGGGLLLRTDYYEI